MVRSFLAIDLKPPMQAKLEEVISSLKYRAPLPVRWVTGKNIHLTLKFLGDSEPERLEKLVENLLPRLKAYESFEIRLAGLGAFPSNKNPRVIWVGVQAPSTLGDLLREIEDIAAELNYEREIRRFSPHLTLGRVSQSATAEQIGKLLEILLKTPVNELGVVRVDSINLIKSELTRIGPIYTNLSVLHFSC